MMDPFLGAGATAKAAFDLERMPVGLDLEPRYVDFARARLGWETGVRAEQLRIEVVPEEEFVPGPTRGPTRHGAGLRGRRP